MRRRRRGCGDRAQWTTAGADAVPPAVECSATCQPVRRQVRRERSRGSPCISGHPVDSLERLCLPCPRTLRVLLPPRLRRPRRPRPSSCARWPTAASPTPFPIQAATLPDSLAGRDVLGRGRTGSGKTVAFALPTVTALAASGRRSPSRPPARARAAADARARQPGRRDHDPPREGVGAQGHHRLRRRRPEPPGRRRCAAASTSSSPAPGASRTSSARATCSSTPSRSRCSTRPTTWPTSASCPA